MIKDVEILELAKKMAIDEGFKSYGIPMVMKVLINTEEFKRSYDADLNELNEYINERIKKYDYPEKADMRGYDIQIILNSLYFASEVKYSNTFEPKKSTIPHLFLSCCARTESCDLDKLFIDRNINKLEIAKKLYKEETGTEPLNDPNEVEYTYKISAKIEKSKIISTDEEYQKKVPIGGERNDEDEKEEFLKRFCRDLIEEAKKSTKPFIGREDVIEKTIRILSKKEKSNPLHIGEAGVGKSAVTKGLAKMIAEGKVPDTIKNNSLYELDITSLLAGTTYRGELEKRLKGILDILKEKGNCILFIDEIHMIIGAGSCGTDSMDVANMIKTTLTEGEIKFIGATTADEYRKYIEKDPALQRRFQKVMIEEPNEETAFEMIKGSKEYYEKHHEVTYTDEAIQTAIYLTKKYIHDRYLPDKAFDILDEAGAYNRVANEKTKEIGKENIEEVISKTFNIPIKRLQSSEIEKVVELKNNLKKNLFGQDEAIENITEQLMLYKCGLSDENKPSGVFLLVGPSGVGKTELSKQIAQNFNMNLVKFDMSEYQDPTSVNKLIGSSAGFVGYDDGGVLTKAIQKNPYSVLLFDEIEKAHPNVYKIFLQMFDEGIITDNKGKKIDCKNCLIIMTSNAGISNLNKQSIGFGASSINLKAIDDAINSTFTSEFRNRLTAIVKFNTLSEDVSKEIVKKELNLLLEKMKKQGYDFKYTEAVLDKIVKEATSVEYGGRNIQRYIDNNIKKLIAKQILEAKLKKNFEIDVQDDFVIL